ncbi:MAG TPA: AsmA family protein [Rhizomicrobium sp.]|jgi:AsmA protein
MAKLLRYGLVGAGVLLLLAIVVPFLIPADAYRVRIERAAYARTGRELKISGPLRVTLFPVPGVHAENVSFANPPGAQTPMAAIASIDVGVRLLPLLTGQVEISEIVLDRPVIALERRADGSGNWTFTPGRAGTGGGGKPGRTGSGFSSRFADIRIDDGAIRYRTATGQTYTAEHANLTIGLVSVDRPVTLDGDLIYRDKRISLEARLASLAPLPAAKIRAVECSLTSDLLQASFKGDVTARGDIEGALKADTTNLRAVADWFGVHLPDNDGFRTLSLDSRIETSGDAISLPEESLHFDAMTVTGRLNADLHGARPALGGDVVIDRLDLDRYLRTKAKPASPQGGNRPATADGWSAEPINLTMLHLFDANLTIDTGVLRIRGLHINKTHLAATLNDGLLNVALSPMALYGGTGKAALVLDARGPVPQFQNAVSFDTVSMRPFLNDALNAQRLAGRGTLVFSVTSQGDTNGAIMRNLSGKGALTIVNGEIAGIDVSGVARLIRSALNGDVVNANAATPFSVMGGSFVIANGVLATKDFHLEGTDFHATGAGTVDLGNRTLDFFVKPKAMLPANKTLGIEFPFRAHGPWQNLAYSADVAGAVSDMVKDIFGSAPPLPDTFGNFLKGGQPQQLPQDTQTKNKKKSVFDDLFGP